MQNWVRQLVSNIDSQLKMASDRKSGSSSGLAVKNGVGFLWIYIGVSAILLLLASCIKAKRIKRKAKEILK